MEQGKDASADEKALKVQKGREIFEQLRMQKANATRRSTTTSDQTSKDQMLQKTDSSSSKTPRQTTKEPPQGAPNEHPKATKTLSSGRPVLQTTSALDSTQPRALSRDTGSIQANTLSSSTQPTGGLSTAQPPQSAVGSDLNQRIASLMKEQSSLKTIYQKEIADYSSRIATLQSQTASLQARIELLEEALESKEAESKRLRESESKFKVEVERCNEEVTTLREELNNLRVQKLALEKEIQDLKRQLSSVDSRLKYETEENARLNKKVKDEMMVIDMLRAENKSYQQRCERAMAELAASTEHIISLQRQLEVSSQENGAGLVEEVKELNKKLQRAEEEKSTSLIRLNKLEFDSLELQKEKDVLSEQLLAAAAVQKATISGCIATYETQLKEVESQISFLKQENHRLQQEIRELKENNFESAPLGGMVQPSTKSPVGTQQDLSLIENAELKQARHPNETSELGDEISSTSKNEISLLQERIALLEEQLHSMKDERDTLNSLLESRGNQTRQFSMQHTTEPQQNPRAAVDFKMEKARLSARISSLESDVSSLEDSKKSLQGQLQAFTSRFQNFQRESEARFNSATRSWESTKRDYENRLAEQDDEINSLRSKLMSQPPSIHQSSNGYENYAGALVQGRSAEFLEREIDSLKRKCKTLSDENRHYEELIQDLTKDRKQRNPLGQQSLSLFSSFSDTTYGYPATGEGYRSQTEHIYSERDIPTLLSTIKQLQDELQTYSMRLASLSNEKDRLSAERYSAPSGISLKLEEQKIRYETEKMELTLVIRNQEQEIESLNQRNRSLTRKCTDLEISFSELQSSRILQASRHEPVGQQDSIKHHLTYQTTINDLRARMDESQNDLFALNEKLAEANSQLRLEKLKVDAAASEKTQLVSRLRDSQTALSDLQLENSKMQTEIRRMVHEKALLEASAQHHAGTEQMNDELSKKIESQYAALLQLETDSRNLHMEVSRLKYAVSDKDREISDLRERDAELQKRLDESVRELRTLSSLNDELQTQVHNMEMSQHSLLNDLQSSRVLKSHMEKEIEELRGLLITNQSPSMIFAEERTMLEQKVSSLASEKASLGKTIADLTEQIKESKVDVQRSSSRIVEMEHLLTESQKKEDQLRSDILNLSERINQLQTENEELNEMVVNLRSHSANSVSRHYSVQENGYSGAQPNEEDNAQIEPTQDMPQQQNSSFEINRQNHEDYQQLQDQLKHLAVAEDKLRVYENMFVSLQENLQGLIHDMNSFPEDYRHVDESDTPNLQLLDLTDLSSLTAQLQVVWISVKQRTYSELFSARQLAFDILCEVQAALSNTESHLHDKTPKESVDMQARVIPDSMQEIVRLVEETKRDVIKSVGEIIVSRGDEMHAVQSKARSLGSTFIHSQLSAAPSEYVADAQINQPEPGEHKEKITQLEAENKELKQIIKDCHEEISSLNALEKRYAHVRKIWDQEVSCLNQERDSTKKLVEVTSLSRTNSYVEATNSNYASMRSLSVRTSYDDGYVGSMRRYARSQYDAMKILSLENTNQSLQREMKSLREYWEREAKVHEMERARFEQEQKACKQEIEILEKKCEDETKLEAVKTKTVQHQYNELFEKHQELILLNKRLSAELEKLRVAPAVRDIPLFNSETSRYATTSRSLPPAPKNRSVAIYGSANGATKMDSILDIDGQLQRILEKYGEIENDTENREQPHLMEPQGSLFGGSDAGLVEYDYDFQPISDRDSKSLSHPRDDAQARELDAFKKQASELQITVSGLQHLVDSMLSLIKVDLGSCTLLQKIEHIHEYVQGFVDKQQNIGYITKELKRAHCDIQKQQEYRTSLIEQKRYLTSQLELRDFMSIVNPQVFPRGSTLNTPKQMKKQTKLKTLALAVLTICRLRSIRMYSIISETQQHTWSWGDDMDYVSSQIRQRDDTIRHLKARLQRFENQSSGKAAPVEIPPPDRKQRNLAREFSREAFYEQGNQRLREEMAAKDAIIEQLSKQIEALSSQARNQRGTPYPHLRRQNAEFREESFDLSTSYPERQTSFQPRGYAPFVDGFK